MPIISKFGYKQLRMSVLNDNFSFTVKVNGDHFGGHFSYHRKGAQVIRLSCRRLPKRRADGYPLEQIHYLRLIGNKWMLWDMDKRAPKKHYDPIVQPVYAVFREAFGLAMLAEA